MTAAGLMRELARQQLSYEVIPHHRTHTAGEEATAVGVAPAEVAKTLVLATDDGFVRAVVPASEKLDLTKARSLVGGGKHTKFATEAELAGSYPMFELGAVPPFGGPPGDRVIVDRRLMEHGRVVLDAGSHSESIRMRTSDLVVAAQAQIADLCRDD